MKQTFVNCCLYSFLALVGLFGWSLLDFDSLSVYFSSSEDFKAGVFSGLVLVGLCFAVGELFGFLFRLFLNRRAVASPDQEVS